MKKKYGNCVKYKYTRNENTIWPVPMGCHAKAEQVFSSPGRKE